MKVLRKFLSI